MAATLAAEKIDALLRKWLRRLPHPFTGKDRLAGYRYRLSILQAEFSLTQVLDRAVSGRVFFEEVIRENLDLGRPDQVQLIFDRRLSRRTPGRLRTRLITHGVIPSLHVDYKRTRIKQYHKEGQALRTETTINDTRDFEIGRSLKNLPQLKALGFAAALRFEDRRVLALLSALVLFCLQPEGFRHRQLREHYAALLSLDPSALTPGQMTYQLRRLRLHGLIERIPKTHRYRLTDFGRRSALFLSRLYARTIRPGLSLIDPHALPTNHRLQQAFDRLDREIHSFCQHEKLAA